MPGAAGLSVYVSAEADAGGPCTVIRLVGEADFNTQALREVLDAETARKPRLLLVDMSGLAFIDSVTLHLIVRAHRQLRADGGRLEIVRPNVAVARLLQLSALDQVIPVRPASGAKDGPGQS